MKKRIYDLRRFDGEGAGEGGAAAAAGAAAGSSSGAQDGASGSQKIFSMAEAESFATIRTERAVRSAFKDYAKQCGLTEEEGMEAMKAYKAAQDAKKPDVDKITKERDDALAKLAERDHSDMLVKKGVRPGDDVDYVMYKIRGMMDKDDKLTFEKAADAFLKEHPKYAKTSSSGFRVKTSADAGGSAGGSAAATGGAGMDEKAKNAAAHDMLRKAFGRI